MHNSANEVSSVFLNSDRLLKSAFIQMQEESYALEDVKDVVVGFVMTIRKVTPDEHCELQRALDAIKVVASCKPVGIIAAALAQVLSVEACGTGCVCPTEPMPYPAQGVSSRLAHDFGHTD